MKRSRQPLFVAEASSHRAQDFDRAIAFVDAAAAAGCDAVEFQLFRIDRMFAPEILSQSPKHLARRDWELPLEFLAPLADRCAIRGIQLACTPFYMEAVEELQPYVDFYKIASYEILVAPLLETCARTGRPIFLSTGMATLDEIRSAASILQAAGARDVTLLHCVSACPAPVGEANLAAIEVIRDATRMAVGWSDHTRKASVIERAVHHWNAAAVEFHLDLDGCAEHALGHCWMPGEIAPLIARIRESFAADGTGFKGPQASQREDREWRADPIDGMRPMRNVRTAWKPAA